MIQRTATCTCGQFRVTVNGDPQRMNLCNCHDCQRRSGSVFQTSGVFADENIVAIEGDRKKFTRPTDRGSEVTMEFCPTCGVSVFFRISDLEGKTLIHGGCFADPTLPAPTHIWFSDRAHPWVVLPDAKIMK